MKLPGLQVWYTLQVRYPLHNRPKKGTSQHVLLHAMLLSRHDIERRMYLQGAGLREISRAVGVGWAQVRKDLISMGVEMRPSGRPRKES